MTYYNNTILLSAGTGVDVVNAIKAELVASGWTLSAGDTYTSVSGGTSLTVNFNGAVGLTAGGKLPLILGGQEVWLVAGSSALLNTLIHVELSISASHFFIKFTGAGPAQTGAMDATFGSPSTMAFITKYTPYFNSNNNPARHFVVGANFYTDPGTLSASSVPSNRAFWVRKPNVDTGTLVNAELVTMRNAVQDQTDVGDLAVSRAYGGGEILWPYVIVSETRGIIGRMNNIFFASDSYTISPGDASGQLPTVLNLIAGGLRHTLTRASYLPNSSNATTFYSPLGLAAITTNQQSPTLNNGQPILGTSALLRGGPFIYVLRGDGS